MQCMLTESILVCCNLVLPLTVSVALWVRHLPQKQLTQYQSPHSQWVFCQSRHTNDLKMGTLVATLPCLCGLVGKASAFRAADPISNPAFSMGFLPGKSYQRLEHGYSRLPFHVSVALWVRRLSPERLARYQTLHSQWVFCQSRLTNDLKMGTLVATLPCLCGLVNKVSALRAANPISNPAFPMGFLPVTPYQQLEHGYSRLPYHASVALWVKLLWEQQSQDQTLYYQQVLNFSVSQVIPVTWMNMGTPWTWVLPYHASVALWVRRLPWERLTQYQTLHPQWVFCHSCHTNDLNMGTPGYPTSCLALEDQYYDLLAWRQYTVTKWDSKFDLQLLS